ncbi:hypothetical protein PLIIFM63780_000106 [Purpureocillium lilacinum]|uniref:aldehyde dehydrogenase (NAD(+)) n=1 Tax=Purpureocillium lilacinum TaxID=33203 RepID=A0A179HEN4_PURLI|nr:hypothetical protein Purlil1_4520 [Purpureocillium lilacinum]OAQ87980.1 aldehyde dehydrogenase [Purpureocillium lilacinum]PWI66785.1 hypothetical protein PCL_04629 [Purpureocillium lilacinum]GJN69697.1 hypothetical protein PLICBS_003747 [Purpureocillium lilacinum]GJN76620.1 hypothetical protein PLIIFM63780_000106 [Purpureocillium lilacinum]
MAGESNPYESRLFINNEFVHATSGRTISVQNPANGDYVGEVEVAGPADVDAAVQAAEAAFKGPWSTFTGPQRRDCLIKFAELIEKRIPEIAKSETLSMGATIMITQHVFGPWTVATLKSSAGFADKIEGQSFTDQDDGTYKIVEWGPSGACAAVSTWNAGLVYFAFYVGAAIASGNTLVFKASEKSPFDALLIADLIPEAGFPPGVINIISGDGETGAHLASHMKIRVLGFTGSAPTGKKVAELAAKSNMKKTILELGGKAPGVVFNDCNLDNVVQVCANHFLAINGQACTASTRLLVQSSIADSFTQRMKEAFETVEATLPRDPIDPSSGIGALADEKQLKHVLEGLEIGRKDGSVLTGGSRKGTSGCYVQPTIFVDVKEGSQLWREEVYGPVVLIKTFETEEEAIQLANDTEYGLAAQIFTRDIARAIRVARKMEAGVVTINAGGIGDLQSAFGGTKGSGHGRTGGWYGVREFMESKTIKINMKYDS